MRSVAHKHALTHSRIFEHHLNEGLRVFDRLEGPRQLGGTTGAAISPGGRENDIGTLVRVDDNVGSIAASQSFHVFGAVQQEATFPETMAIPITVNRLDEHSQTHMLWFYMLEHIAELSL